MEKIEELYDIIDMDDLDNMDLDEKYKAPENSKVIQIKDLPSLLKLIKENPAVVVDFWATFIDSLAHLKKKFDLVA